VYLPLTQVKILVYTLSQLEKELETNVYGKLFDATDGSELNYVELTEICNSIISRASPDVEALEGAVGSSETTFTARKLWHKRQLAMFKKR
jgi:hypothetical protein